MGSLLLVPPLLLDRGASYLTKGFTQAGHRHPYLDMRPSSHSSLIVKTIFLLSNANQFAHVKNISNRACWRVLVGDNFSIFNSAKCFENVSDKLLMNRDQKFFLLNCELPFIVTCFSSQSISFG
jgi:hypothetical protein